MITLPPNTTIRFLNSDDAPSYQQLRLESLQNSANAFLSLYKNEVLLNTRTFSQHLQYSLQPPYFGYYGLFVDSKLVGYVQVCSVSFEKKQHLAEIYNVYITPAQRRRGLAKTLFLYVFDKLKENSQIEQVYLSCTASNKTALNFYKQLGFRRFAVKRQAIKWQGVYDDEIEMVKML